jgi:hypothetical protein
MSWQSADRSMASLRFRSSEAVGAGSGAEIAAEVSKLQLWPRNETMARSSATQGITWRLWRRT